MDSLAPNAVINTRSLNALAQRFVDKLRIKTPSIAQKVVNLSGGNQQKVALAKWLARDMDVLIFDEPTRGIDVGAKVDIYELMNELAANGVGIIMISSELPEILGMSDRILVMSGGRVAREFSSGEATQEEVLGAALGH
jgi:ribose transport system ATP-binding protein